MKRGLNYSILALSLVLFLVSQNAFANDKNSILNANFTVDFFSVHTWRGYKSNNTPTIEPTLTLSTPNSTLGLWAAQSIDSEYTEIDLYFTQTYKNVSFSILDYYCPPSYKNMHEVSDYSKNTTNHLIELTLDYNNLFNTPFNFMVGTIVYGDDLDSEGNNRYSTYFQFSYSTLIEKNTLDLVLGFNVFDNSMYADSFSVVNAGITAKRNLNAFNKIEIPVQASLIANPVTDSIYLKFGFSL